MTTLPLQLARTLTPEQVAALAVSLAAFPAGAATRGADVAMAGRVHDEQRADADLRARVRGTRTWAVRWRFAHDHAEPVCSCPDGPLCKHAYAAGLRVLAAAATERSELPPGMFALVPRAMRSETRPPASRAPAREAGEGAGRADPRLRALREAETPWQRLGAAEGLLWRAGNSHEAIAGLTLDDVINDPDPDVRCWRLAKVVAAAPGVRLPRPLQPWLERDDLAARAAESTRRTVVARLSRWAEGGSAQARRLRVVLGLRPPGTVESARVTIQARFTGPRLTDEPRTASQLSQLAGDLRRDPRLLSPPQARLLRLLTTMEMSGLFGDPRTPSALDNEQLNLLLDRAAGSPFVTWGDDLSPELAVRAGIKAGSRVRLDGDDLRLELACHAEEGELRLALALADAEGRKLPLDPLLRWGPAAALVATHPTVVLQEGSFHRVTEEPPSDIVRMIAELRGLPLRREDAPLLDRLSARFEGVADALNALTRTHVARPVVTLDLRESDWLQVRVFAYSGASAWTPGAPPEPGAALFEHTPDAGWLRAAADAPPATGAALALEDAHAPAQEDGGPDGTAPGDDRATGPDARSAGALAPWREVPEPARVAPALAWLDELGAARGDRRGPGGIPPEADAARGWWLRLQPRTADRLETLWRARPRSVAWFGNRSARELLAGRRRLRARVSVTASGVDWLSVRAEWEAEGFALTDADLAKLRSAPEGFVRLSGGWVRRDEAGAHDALADALADLGLEADGREQRLPLWQLAHASDRSFAALADAGADGETLAALSRIRETLAGFSGIPRLPVPPGLTGTLRPYQFEGLDFLAWTASLGLGAVLADDMGLGKTIQALAWIQHLVERDPKGGPTLVVCPASVAHNWAREASRFTPWLRVLVLGSGRERRQQIKRAAEYDLVITNYALLRRDIAQWRELELRVAVLDEAQNIKNPDAAVTRAARDLRARHRIALTGTPLENRALDLWSILSFVNPALLGPRARFVARYDRPDAPPHARRLLAARLRPVLLRRLKEQVERDLPARIEERLDCELTPGQRRHYLAELVRSRQLLGSLGGTDAEVARGRVIILSVLTRLRQICCHPALVGGDPAAGSGKFNALFELLEPLLAEGQKVLVFSQFVRALDLIAERLKHDGIPFHVLTGDTPTRSRGRVVAEFSESEQPCVFLVSLRAGGTGLNLTAASHVVLFDPWWNPAVEAQAIDRTHRIGQTRAVVAYRLYAEGTVEERIAELQQRKAALARGVLGEEGFTRSLTREDLAYLLAD